VFYRFWKQDRQWLPIFISVHFYWPYHFSLVQQGRWLGVPPPGCETWGISLGLSVWWAVSAKLGGFTNGIMIVKCTERLYCHLHLCELADCSGYQGPHGSNAHCDS
jgi:hypothetical protein